VTSRERAEKEAALVQEVYGSRGVTDLTEWFEEFGNWGCYTYYEGPTFIPLDPDYEIVPRGSGWWGVLYRGERLFSSRDVHACVAFYIRRVLTGRKGEQS